MCRVTMKNMSENRPSPSASESGLSGYSNETLETLLFVQGNYADEQYAGSFANVRGRPVILFLFLTSFFTYAFFSWKRVQIAEYGFSYTRIVLHGEFWRLIPALVSHDDILHLVFDLFMLWSAAALELKVGSGQILSYTFLLLALTSSAYCLMYDIFIRRFRLGPNFGDTYTAGSTSVIFGLLTILSYQQSRFDVPLFPGLLLPLGITPLVLLFIASMIVNRSKFYQHCFGILSGSIVASGALAWVNAYWAFTFMLWTCGLMVISIKCTTRLNIPWVEVYVWPYSHIEENVESDHGVAPLDSEEAVEVNLEEGRNVVTPTNVRVRRFHSSSTRNAHFSWNFNVDDQSE